MSDARYPARYSHLFARQLDSLPTTEYVRVGKIIETVEDNPYFGRMYQPAYDAALPPVPCRHIFVQHTTKTLYYRVNEEEHSVDFFYVDDARSDPKRRFSEL